MKQNPLTRVREAIGANGIILIVVAAVLLVVINLIQYHYAREEISEEVKLKSLSELSAKSLAIQNIMNSVETAIRNHTEDVSRQLAQPDSMFAVARSIVEQNPEITGSSISFIESYYPGKGKWFEAYAVRNEDGGIDTLQLGSINHNYFQSEFFEKPLKTGKAVWTNPYLDSDGAKMLLTTFSAPVFNSDGEIVAVLDADISLDWLDDILTVEYAYPSSYHVLLSKDGKLMSVADKKYLMKTIPEMSADYGNNTFLNLNDGMLSGGSGETFITDKQGNKYISYYMPVDEDTGWSIAIINSEKEIFGDFQKMKVTLLWLSIAGFLILVLIIIRAVLNIRRLQRVTTEREKIRSELKIASEIQRSMLPKSEDLISCNDKIEISGTLFPAKEVGGDLYDFFIKDEYLYFCIGDVSGKGVPAAMFMTVTRSLFRTIAPYTYDASKVLWYMNRTLTNINETNMFVTFFVGILNIKTGELNFSNAGHNGPVIIEDGQVRFLEVIPNLSLGIFEDFRFEPQRLQLKKNSLLFLYTDGLTEAMNENREEYTEERMIEKLKELDKINPEISLNNLLTDVYRDIKTFNGKADQSDDLTMLAIRFKNNPVKNKRKKLELTSEIESVKILNRFIDETIKEEGLPYNLGLDLKLALEESVVNIINYAYPKEKPGKIEIIFTISNNDIIIDIMDKGKAFDPTSPVEVDLDSEAEERPIGGLGIFLIQQLSDEVSYKRENETNILTIKKSIYENNDQ